MRPCVVTRMISQSQIIVLLYHAFPAMSSGCAKKTKKCGILPGENGNRQKCAPFSARRMCNPDVQGDGADGQPKTLRRSRRTACGTMPPAFFAEKEGKKCDLQLILCGFRVIVRLCFILLMKEGRFNDRKKQCGYGLGSADECADIAYCIGRRSRCIRARVSRRERFPVEPVRPSERRPNETIHHNRILRRRKT